MKIQDIQLPDKTLRDSFINKYQSGDYAGAFEILANAQVSSKAAIASVFNTMRRSIVNLEDFYWTGVEIPLSVDWILFNALIQRLVDRGDYNSNVEYFQGNVVSVDDELYLYINDENSVGTPVTDTTYWLKLGLKGEDGAPSLGLNFRLNWSSSAVYLKNDAVIYKDAIYYATQDNPGTPGVTGSGWGLVLTLYQADIQFYDGPYQGKYNGQIIFEASGE